MLGDVTFSLCRILVDLLAGSLCVFVSSPDVLLPPFQPKRLVAVLGCCSARLLRVLLATGVGAADDAALTSTSCERELFPDDGGDDDDDVGVVSSVFSIFVSWLLAELSSSASERDGIFSDNMALLRLCSEGDIS